MRIRRFIFATVVSFVSLLVGLIALEGALRLKDGYQLFSVNLHLLTPVPVAAPEQVSPASAKWRNTTDAVEYVERLPLAPEAQREWYTLSPAAQEIGPPDADLAERERDYNNIQANYEWNRRGVVRALCQNEHRNQAVFNQFKDVFVFDAMDGSELPAFRFLQKAKYPTGLRTNTFGYRGPDISLNKPHGTVRIAFVGASTTIAPHAEAYSYPDLVGFWLNLWARARNRPLTFETINAAREGTNSRTFQAVVRQELVPLEPDLVVYYEGANQFWPAEFIPEPLPPRSRISGPPTGVLGSHSAVARRLERARYTATLPGSEPAKPPLTVNWPNGLSETDPDLKDPRLPESLRDILGDLETIRRALQDEGGHLVMSSFSWLVYPGLRLDMHRDAEIHQYLNVTYWPFSYAHLRRFADFQNRVFRKFVQIHDLDFIDFAAVYPRDPRLFEDAIHMTRAGIRLQAWIMFNGLLPAVERRVAAGELPRQDRIPLTVHPAFATARQLVDVDSIKASCGAPW